MTKRCKSSDMCDHNYYCDTAVSYCEPCRNICHPAQGTSNFCKQECPNYPGTTKPTLTAISISTITTMNAISPPLESNNQFLYIFLVILLVLVVVVIVLVVILFMRFKMHNQLPDIGPALKDCCCSCMCCYKCKKDKHNNIEEDIPLQTISGETDDRYGKSPVQPVQEETTELHNSAILLPSQSSSNFHNFPSTSKHVTDASYNYIDGSRNNSDIEQSTGGSKFHVNDHDKTSQKLDSIPEKLNNPEKEHKLQLTEPSSKASERQVKPKRTLSQSIETQTDFNLSLQERPLSTTIETQTEEPFFDLPMYSSVVVPKLREEPIEILRPTTEQNRPSAVTNEKQMEEAVKSIVVKPEYQNDRDTVHTVVSETIDTRDPTELNPRNGNNDQTDLKAVGGLTIPQQETSPLIPDSGAATNPKPPRRIHPNKRIYEILKGIHWVQGYYSEGRSIEIYIDFEDILPERALEELVRRTGERPEKFRVLQNEPVQYQSMKFAAII